MIAFLIAAASAGNSVPEGSAPGRWNVVNDERIMAVF